VVDGDFWGVMGAGVAEGEALGDHIEDRLAEFTERVATAISSSASRAELARLADEQAALRRVATPAARAVPPSELFGAVGEEVGRLVGADLAAMIRYESDNTLTAMAGWAAVGEPMIEVGGRWALEEAALAVATSSPRPSRRRRRGPRYNGSPTSRRRCDVWRRWLRASHRRGTCWAPSPRKWDGCRALSARR
jgi:hypothetical protein